MTFEELRQVITGKLRDAGVPDAAYDTFALLEYVSGMNRAAFELHKGENAGARQEEELLSLAERRARRIPLQHLLGETEFMGLKFYVCPDVLIPRPDTETLAEHVLQLCRRKRTPRILDLCTGSGCIAVSLAKYLPEALVDATDISGDALRCARRNAERNGCRSIRLAQGDLLEAYFPREEQSLPTGAYDVIVSNPPYIKTAEISTLMPEVRDHDPLLALDGHEDGLYFYRQIASQAPAYLKSQGHLCLEIGHDQAGDVSELLLRAGFSEPAVIKDLSGNDRVVTAQWKMETENV